MHSSRMRTARLLPISPSMHCKGGGYLPRGVYLPGGCTYPGGCTCLGDVPAREGGTCPGGVPTQGVYLPRGCTCPGGLPAQGVYLTRDVYLPALEVYLPRYSPRGQTDTCKNISFANFVCGL